MNPTGHPDLGPELRQLAQAILDKIDPALRAAAALIAARADENPGRCQQVWCPVCALAALIKGEEHPLLAVVSEHSVALLAVVRALIDTVDTNDDVDHTNTNTDKPDPPDGPPEGPPAGQPDTGRYQPIPIHVQE